MRLAQCFCSDRPGVGVFPEKLGGGVRSPSQNPYSIYDHICDIPYPIYDQSNYSLPDYELTITEIKTLFQKCVIISVLVQTNVKLP